MGMSNKSYAILRTTTLNGNTVECDRLMGFAKSKEEADAKTEAMYDSVMKLTAVRGFGFVFYSKEVLTDAT